MLTVDHTSANSRSLSGQSVIAFMALRTWFKDFKSLAFSDIVVRDYKRSATHRGFSITHLCDGTAMKWWRYMQRIPPRQTKIREQLKRHDWIHTIALTFWTLPPKGPITCCTVLIYQNQKLSADITPNHRNHMYLYIKPRASCQCQAMSNKSFKYSLLDISGKLF